MAFKTAHLAPEGTIRHTMEGIVLAPHIDPKPVVLILKHAGKSNERFRKALENARAKGKTDEASMIEIFARTVIEGWEHVYNDQDKPVPYSPEECIDLFNSLVDANRHSSVIAAMEKAGDPNPFASKDALGKE